MAIYYVSNEESNGFNVGNDSNDGLSSTTPFLSATVALDTLADNDTLIFNDGYYIYDNGAAVPRWNPQFNFEIQVTNDFATTLEMTETNSSGNTQGIKFDAPATGTRVQTIGKLILTTGGGIQFAVWMDGEVGEGVLEVNLSCQVAMRNSLEAGVFGRCRTLNLNCTSGFGFTSESSFTNSMSYGCMELLENRSSNINIESCTFAVNGCSTTTGRGGIYIEFETIVDGGSVAIENLTGTLNLTSPNTKQIGLHVLHCPANSCDIQNFNWGVNYQGSSAIRGMMVTSPAADNLGAEGVKIRNGRISSNSADGLLVVLGDEDGVDHNLAGGLTEFVEVTGNSEGVGNIHGVCVIGGSGCVQRYNTVRQCNVPVLVKNGQAESYQNSVYKTINSGALVCRGGEQGTKFYSNIIYVPGGAMGLLESAQDSEIQISTGVEFYGTLAISIGGQQPSSNLILIKVGNTGDASTGLSSGLTVDEALTSITTVAEVGTTSFSSIVDANQSSSIELLNAVSNINQIGTVLGVSQNFGGTLKKLTGKLS